MKLLDEARMKYAISLISVICCLTLFAIHYGLEKESHPQSPFGKIAYDFTLSVIPNFFAALLGFSIVYFVLEKPGLSPTGRQIDSLREELNVLKKKLEHYSEISSDISAIVRVQDEKARLLASHSYSRKVQPFVGSYYRQVLRNYHENFELTSRGFQIKNEGLSLLAYTNFWEYMIAEQRTRLSGRQDCIIARIVHSNSIHIWTNSHDKYQSTTERLLKLQKNFVELGGVIVRIFLGNEEFPNADYQKALAVMEKHNIEAQYIKKPIYHQLSFDFVLLDDEKFVLKWISDSMAQDLLETVVQDSVEKEIRLMWHNLYEDLKRRNTPISSIPAGRHLKFD